MSVAIDLLTNSGSKTTSTFSFNHTITGSNPVLLVLITMERGAGAVAVTGITWGGVALTKGVAQVGASGGLSGEIWYLLAPATGTASVAVTLNNAPDAAVAEAASFTGAHQTNPPTFTSETNLGTPTLSLSSGTSDYAIDNLVDGAAQTPSAANQTGQWNVAGFNYYHYGSTAPGASPTRTMSWQATGSNVVQCMADIAPGAAATIPFDEEYVNPFASLVQEDRSVISVWG